MPKLELPQFHGEMEYWITFQRIISGDDGKVFEATSTLLGDRWHKEVLHRYQSRPKWKASQSEVQVGNLVLISDDNRRPLSAHGKNTKTHTRHGWNLIE
ncbi:hypothetical protein TNCV_4508561 [Trichonephila clavipes]|nr:hypothetical protein TNCV_4508561 [Trichonephila clavipes]